LQELYFITTRILERGSKKGKKWQEHDKNKTRLGVVTVLPYLRLCIIRGYEMETCHSNTRLPLYGKGDAATFLTKSRHTPRMSPFTYVIGDVSY
jgi:hypothetical protein